MEQQAEGIRETDPAEGSVDPHSLIELQDTKMIQKLFEKMQQSMPSRTVTKAQESIGVGFSGLTNDSGPGSVMILQPNSPSIRDQMHSTGRSRSPPVGARKYGFPEQHFTSESALIGGESWHSWIDDRFWEDLDLTFETLPD
ncbi:hypothetical protein LTS13_004086 [Exophiala xenobiotica]|nr:hypothetical protein LTR40_008936 [Exophiala xenobiotica]KAK5379194.1 hypothetical protein LTS13_004086 [Exophiala xenobiotica]